MENRDDLARRIGSKVKELRKESGLPQKKLADATGLSSGLLSRIENGLAMPPIPTLQVISDTLKAEIGYFFQDQKEKGYIITNPGDRRVVVSKSGPHGKVAYELELMAEGMRNPFMEPAIVTHVGEEEEVEARIHDGQEFMYVLEGKIKLTLRTKEFILKKGNSAYWNGNVPHKAIGLGQKSGRSLHVHLIPGKWTGTFQHEDLPVQRSRENSKKSTE